MEQQVRRGGGEPRLLPPETGKPARLSWRLADEELERLPLIILDPQSIEAMKAMKIT